MGIGFEDWRDLVNKYPAETRSVVPQVAVSPPSERGGPDAYSRAIQDATPWGSSVSTNAGHPMSAAARALADAVGRAGIPGNPIGSIFRPNGPRLSAGEGGADRGYGPITNYPQGSADSQAARLGINRGGQVDNFGPGLAHNVPQRTAPTTAAETGGAPLADRLAGMRDELAMYRARDDMGQQQRLQGMQANANWATDWTAKRDAENRARSANFRATNGADMVLASGNPQYEDQRQAIRDAAKMENANLAIADANLQKSQAGLTGPPRNYIEEEAKAMREQGLNTVARARATEAGVVGALAGPNAANLKEDTLSKRLSNQQQMQMLDISAKMGAAKTPAEARAFERQLLAMAGKTGKDWKAIPISGKKGVDPATFQPFQEPDTVLIYNEQTGEQQIIGGSQAGAGGGVPPGMTLFGTSNGKPVYKDKDGKMWQP